MNVSYTITENVLARLGDISKLGVDRQALNEDVGRQLANDLREHFRMRNLNGPRNKFGARSSGFWSEIRNSVRDGEVDDGGVTVTISDPRVAQKYYGGRITMDQHRLAIPARAEAYNKSPRIFSNLRAVFFRSGAVALVDYEPEQKRVKGEKRIGRKPDRGLIFYWLVKAVEQEPDYDTLPQADIEATRLLEAAERHVQRITDRNDNEKVITS